MNTKTKERTASLNMRCTEATKERLQVLAEARGWTMSEVVDQLISEAYHDYKVVFGTKKRAVK